MRSNKKEVGLIIGTLLVVGVVIGSYVFLQPRTSSTQQDQQVPAQNVSDSIDNKQADANPPNNQKLLQVQGSSTNDESAETLTTRQDLIQIPKQPDQSTSPQLPKPDEFDMYEEYRDQQQALYAEITIGDGEEIKTGDTVSVAYQGWLTDGQLFDESRKNEDGLIEPFTFKLGAQQVIRGWDEGIVGMKIGGKRRLIIPPAAGYGQTGNGPIPPNALLVFDVYAAHLHDVQP